MRQKYQKTAFLALIILVASSATWFSCRNKRVNAEQKLFRVSGYVTQTNPYCGGARPSDEMLQEYNRPKPYPQKVLVIRQAGDAMRKLPLRVTSNDSGYYSLNLPAGAYDVYQEEQLSAPSPADLRKPGTVEVDSVCLEKWKVTPLVTFRLSGRDIDSVNINFHKPCFISGDIPCLRYVGPMPP